MMENIHWAFEKIVKELKWMDETTKNRTLYKAQQMKTFVGFPELINDPAQLDDYYSDVRLITFQTTNGFVHGVLIHFLAFAYSSKSWKTIILAMSCGMYNWT